MVKVEKDGIMCSSCSVHKIQVTKFSSHSVTQKI